MVVVSLVAISEAQFKQKVVSKSKSMSAIVQAKAGFDTTLTGAFSFTTGFTSSAGTLKHEQFYKGTANFIRGFEDSSYIDLWTAIPGTGGEYEAFGLSYGKPIWVPVQDVMIFFNAGVMFSLAEDSLSNRNWIGLPVGARANYEFIRGVGITGVVDLVPSFNISKSQTQIEKFGLTVMGSIGLIYTP